MTNHRFRFRSPERDRETDERRLGRVRLVARSAVADAEAEAKGLRARIVEARRSALFLVEHIDDGEYAPTSRAALKRREQHLFTIEQRLAQLEDHLTALRKLERRLNRFIDQPLVFGKEE
jgi:3-methyladenine DNA glycosylase/8-oxoguanine DNA glycosylase